MFSACPFTLSFYRSLFAFCLSAHSIELYGLHEDDSFRLTVKDIFILISSPVAHEKKRLRFGTPDKIRDN